MAVWIRPWVGYRLMIAGLSDGYMGGYFLKCCL